VGVGVTRGKIDGSTDGSRSLGVGDGDGVGVGFGHWLSVPGR
jgi:hypothetical protein